MRTDMENDRGKHGQPGWFLVGICFLAMTPFSCRQKAALSGSDQRLAALYEDAKDALVYLSSDEQPAKDFGERNKLAVGFFISPNGRVLTSAHELPSTSTVFILFKGDGPSSSCVAATVTKRDPEMDLAFLEPAQAISPPKYLPLDLQEPTAPGQGVVILTVFLTWRKQENEVYYFTALLPARVVSVYRDGLFATDVYSFSGVTGSPVVDLSSERVIGVCVRGNEAYDFAEQVSSTTYPLPDGTTVSLPVPYLVLNYGTARSLASARTFFEDPR